VRDDRGSQRIGPATLVEARRVASARRATAFFWPTKTTSRLPREAGVDRPSFALHAAAAGDHDQDLAERLRATSGSKVTAAGSGLSDH
jgi:hypothetical protein